MPTEPGPSDVTRRTHLANERTYLAWWRTALAAIAMAIGVGRLLPEVTGGTAWPYVAVGSGWALVGIGMTVFAVRRREAVDRALLEGGFVHLTQAEARGLALVSVVLGAATLALIVLAP